MTEANNGKMQYSQEVFKQHIGRRYLDKIKTAGIVCGVCVILFALLLIAQNVFFINIPNFLMLLPLVVAHLLILVVIPVFFAYYYQDKLRATRQKQSIENGFLHVVITLADGYAWGAVEHHKRDYLVSQITNIQKNKYYIIVTGQIHMTDIYNGNKTQKEIQELKIPRCFTNEEQILEENAVKVLSEINQQLDKT